MKISYNKGIIMGFVGIFLMIIGQMTQNSIYDFVLLIGGIITGIVIGCEIE